MEGGKDGLMEEEGGTVEGQKGEVVQWNVH